MTKPSNEAPYFVSIGSGLRGMSEFIESLSSRLPRLTPEKCLWVNPAVVLYPEAICVPISSPDRLRGSVCSSLLILIPIFGDAEYVQDRQGRSQDDAFQGHVELHGVLRFA